MELLRTRYQPALIPGMVDVVRALAPHCTLAVISTNGIEAIRRILVGAGIATCFSHVFSGDVEPQQVGVDPPLPRRPALRSAPACARRPTRTATPVGGALGGAGRRPGHRHRRRRGRGPRGWRARDRRRPGACTASGSCSTPVPSGSRLWPQEIIAWLLPDGMPRPAACACSTAPGGELRDTASGARAVRHVAAADPIAQAARQRRRTAAAAPGCGAHASRRASRPTRHQPVHRCRHERLARARCRPLRRIVATEPPEWHRNRSPYASRRCRRPIHQLTPVKSRRRTMKVIAEGFNASKPTRNRSGSVKYLPDPGSVIALIQSGKLKEHIAARSRRHDHLPRAGAEHGLRSA